MYGLRCVIAELDVLVLTPLALRTMFVAKSTNLLDMFIVVYSLSFSFQRVHVPTTRVRSQWFLNLLVWQAWAASLAAQA